MTRPDPQPPVPPADAPNPAAQYDILLPEELAAALQAARTTSGHKGLGATIGEFETPGEVRVYLGTTTKGIFLSVSSAVDYLSRTYSKPRGKKV